MTTLKPPEHQVAGHQASAGQLGPLVDGSGRFFKPLQSDGRGDGELAFYSSFASHPAVPAAVRRRFFPGFHGTLILPASDGSGHRLHLVLDDLLTGLHSPSVIDLKIGARTWAPDHPEDYVQKCLAKDRQSTSLALGFRISGLQIQQTAAAPAGDPADLWRPSKAKVKKYTAKDVRRALRQFVSANKATEPEPDAALAAAVYGGPDGVLPQLRELKAWFEEQTLFHFYSASVLVAYEKDAAIGDATAAAAAPRVKLVDFAHVVEGDGVIDHNFLGGLCSLIKFISDVLDSPESEDAQQVEKDPIEHKKGVEDNQNERMVSA